MNSALKFYGNGSLLNKQTVAALHYNWAYGQPTLAPVGLMGLAQGSDVTVRFNYEHASASNNAIAILMARDPREMYDTLSTFVDDDAGWKAEVDLAHTPPGFAVVYPSVFKLTSEPHYTEMALSTSSFWPQSNAQGAAAAPGLQGSVKCVFTYQEGQCFNRVPISTIAKQVSDKLYGSFVQKAGETRCVDRIREFSHVTSFLHHGITNAGLPDGSPTGGFFLKDSRRRPRWVEAQHGAMTVDAASYCFVPFSGR